MWGFVQLKNTYHLCKKGLMLSPKLLNMGDLEVFGVCEGWCDFTNWMFMCEEWKKEKKPIGSWAMKVG
jgi:hypothetical protein